jgi:hypothetical protein
MPRKAMENMRVLKQYAAIFVAGRLDQMVEAKPEECAKAEYQPFPEAETLTR